MLVVSDFGVVVTKYYEGYITDMMSNYVPEVAQRRIQTKPKRDRI
jgi:hypothetical protein